MNLRIVQINAGKLPPLCGDQIHIRKKTLDGKMNLLKSGHPQRMPKAPHSLSNQYIAQKHSLYICIC